jgi:hypothetical protein
MFPPPRLFPLHPTPPRNAPRTDSTTTATAPFAGLWRRKLHTRRPMAVGGLAAATRISLAAGRGGPPQPAPLSSRLTILYKLGYGAPIPPMPFNSFLRDRTDFYLSVSYTVFALLCYSLNEPEPPLMSLALVWRSDF